jgi:TonB family protein
VKVVLRLPSFATPRSRYFLVSGFLHLSFALALILSPLLGAGNRIPEDTALVVSMVASLPPAKPPPAKTVAVPPVEKKTPPKPEGVRAEPVIPPEPKPEKKKQDQPEPLPEPQPREESPAPDERVDDPASTVPEATETSGDAGGDAEASIATVGLDDLRHAWYRSAVINALHNAWIRPVVAGSRETIEVTIAFDIVKNGTAYNPRVVVSSGFPALDRSAQRAVSDAAFPPLPNSWSEPVVTAQMVFRLHPENP